MIMMLKEEESSLARFSPASRPLAAEKPLPWVIAGGAVHVHRTCPTTKTQRITSHPYSTTSIIHSKTLEIIRLNVEFDVIMPEDIISRKGTRLVPVD